MNNDLLDASIYIHENYMEENKFFDKYFKIAYGKWLNLYSRKNFIQ